jgi:tRNA(Ile)-lysidine synthase
VKGHFYFEWYGMHLLEKFEDFSRGLGLFGKGGRILMAVSGGMDSVVLLDLFMRIRHPWSLTLAVAHVNHSLRGKDADGDEIFVRELSRRQGILFYSQKTNVREYAKVHRLSLEEAGRAVRFDFFEWVFDILSYDRLALGHQANDQAETILMHLTRGAGLRGLGGIRPIRGRVIHPLLFAMREEVEEYARERQLCFVEDASNKDRRFLRNRIRWDVVRRLEESVGSRVVSSICRAGQAAAEAEAYVEDVARRVGRRIVKVQSPTEIILDIFEFLRYFKIVQKTVVLQVLREVCRDKESWGSSEIDRILRLAEAGKSGGIVELGCGVRVIRSGDRLVFLENYPRLDEVEVQVGQTAYIKEIEIQFLAEVVSKKTKDIVNNRNPRIAYLDYDLLSFPLRIRSFRPGDSFVPLGMKGKKKLHDFFVDEKVPNYRRSSVPLLVGCDGIVWIAGYRMDDRYKVTERTTRILKMEIRPNFLGKGTATS